MIDNPGIRRKEHIDEASAKLRELSCELLANFYSMPRFYFSSDDRKYVDYISKRLIGLSNSLHKETNGKYNDQWKKGIEKRILRLI
jgi:hypothetical protein